MESTKKIRWGIVGPGIIAHEFAHDFQFVAKGELVAVASQSRERGSEFAKKFNIPKVYHTYQDLYSDRDIDVVYVATPHTFHLENSSDAMRAGKAVLCEKPITINPQQLTELLEVSNQTGNYIMEGMWTCFLPAIQKAQQWVKENKIGTIRHVKSDFGYPVPFDAKGRMYNPDLAGGALLDMGIYTIAMAILFTEEFPRKMTVVSKKASTGVDNDVTMLFEYENALATLCTSFRCKLNNWTYIIGDEGYIAIPDFWRAKECFLYKVEECTEHFKDDRRGFGFNYETDAVNEDLLAGKKESAIMPHSFSMNLQEHMYQVSNFF